ncbi:tyrosine-type recombinase/integrase [Oerskovia jenensis]|uniref:Integrase n=1 Tax=Oerskovia jenensis TaxID=162169 RepID=A0ABS2LEW3_9CELL|nr:site-specific integrase [Oerskovia jenensis]MBM7478960.1 integrase [Oerskovia jenensis]
MSDWSGPWVTVTTSKGTTSWSVPADWGFADLPVAGKVRVRWRAPGGKNPRSRTLWAADAALAPLLRTLVAASANPGSWTVAADGSPVPTAPTSARPALPKPVHAAHSDSDPLGVVGPHNALLGRIAAGEYPLGATIADVIRMVVAERAPGWSPAHNVNMRNVLAFVEHVMVYREPNLNDTPEVVAWKRARLELDGVMEGGSLHVALILPPDLTEAISLRRYSNRRADLLNVQRQLAWHQSWTRYDDAQRARAAGIRRGGRLPARPADTLELLPVESEVSARTEELFAKAIQMLLNHAADHGLLPGRNPFPHFAGRTRSVAGFRRPQPMAIHERNVVPLGTVIDLAEAIARQGPTDPRTGCAVGDRFRALVLASVAAGRPSEYAALRPDDYRSGPEPRLVFRTSAGPAHTAGTRDGTSYAHSGSLKGRAPGQVREVPIPRAVAEVLDAHLAAGYASRDHLFTGPGGGPLRWGNHVETYWRPAVREVLGHAAEPQLRNLTLHWLRKGAITWLLRSGMNLLDVAELAGHDHTILINHYAGVTHSADARRIWTGWEDAWAWASSERVAVVGRIP